MKLFALGFVVASLAALILGAVWIAGVEREAINELHRIHKSEYELKQEVSELWKERNNLYREIARLKEKR